MATDNKSFFKWLLSQIMKKKEPSYPDGWADLFGSVSDSSFKRPEQPRLETREPL